MTKNYSDNELLDFKIVASFVNKGTQLCLSLFFKTKVSVIHDIDDQLSITLSTVSTSTSRLLQTSEQGLNISAVDID